MNRANLIRFSSVFVFVTFYFLPINKTLAEITADMCDYPQATNGCAYIPGPDYVPLTSCGMIQSCPAPALAPSINYVGPAQGTGNTRSMITGANLASTSAVTFYQDGKNIISITAPQLTVGRDGKSVTFNISTLFSVNVPPGLYQIKIVTPLGFSNSVPFMLVPSLPPPRVGGVDPSQGGPNDPGTIYGQNFSNATAITVRTPLWRQLVSIITPPYVIVQDDSRITFNLSNAFMKTVNPGSYLLTVGSPSGESNYFGYKFVATGTNQPNINPIFPIGGEVIVNKGGRSSIARIAWATNGLATTTPIKIDLLDTAGAVVKNIAASTPNNHQYLWQYDSFLASGKYKIAISTQSDGRVVSNTGGYFTLITDTTPYASSTATSTLSTDACANGLLFDPATGQMCTSALGTTTATTTSSGSQIIQYPCLDLQNNLHTQLTDATTSGEVTSLQNFLKAAGFLNADATGYFGRLTLEAAKAFQQAYSIGYTGYVGILTRTKIKSLTCSH